MLQDGVEPHEQYNEHDAVCSFKHTDMLIYSPTSRNECNSHGYPKEHQCIPGKRYEAILLTAPLSPEKSFSHQQGTGQNIF